MVGLDELNRLLSQTLEGREIAVVVQDVEVTFNNIESASLVLALVKKGAPSSISGWIENYLQEGL